MFLKNNENFSISQLLYQISDYNYLRVDKMPWHRNRSKILVFQHFFSTYHGCTPLGQLLYKANKNSLFVNNLRVIMKKKTRYAEISTRRNPVLWLSSTETSPPAFHFGKVISVFTVLIEHLSRLKSKDFQLSLGLLKIHIKVGRWTYTTAILSTST